jgi:hypothetical protein
VFPRIKEISGFLQRYDFSAEHAQRVFQQNRSIRDIGSTSDRRRSLTGQERKSATKIGPPQSRHWKSGLDHASQCHPHLTENSNPPSNGRVIVRNPLSGARMNSK